jgi:hypothetical protein
MQLHVDHVADSRRVPGRDVLVERSRLGGRTCCMLHGWSVPPDLPLAAFVTLEHVGRGLPKLCAALALALHLFLDRLALLSLLVCCELLPARSHSLVAERIRPRPMLRRKIRTVLDCVAWDSVSYALVASSTQASHFAPRH